MVFFFYISYPIKLYLDFNMDINICITLMYACSKLLNPFCLRWTVQWYIYLQSFLAVFKFSSLFLPQKKRFNSILWNTSHYYLYICCILKLLWTIQYFFLLEFLEISCLSNLNCYYLLLMWVGVTSLYNVVILCIRHYILVIVFIKIF